jgi:hypothetical protein
MEINYIFASLKTKCMKTIRQQKHNEVGKRVLTINDNES